MFTPKQLVQHYGLPEGSIMLLNKKGYMDEKNLVAGGESNGAKYPQDASYP